MRYYKGKPMRDYKPKRRTSTVEGFCRLIDEARMSLRVVGCTAYDADGDRRIILRKRKF